VGVDLLEGDVVADLSKSIEPLEASHFALVICCSVLEHVERPWAMAQNITKLLRPGGRVYLSVPWVWRFHAYPDDYWRFTWRAIESLFPGVEWEAPEYSTTREGEFFPAVKDADNNLAVVIEGRKFMPYLMLHMIGTWTGTTK
jgi:SAM-dependent methyltransferase